MRAAEASRLLHAYQVGESATFMVLGRNPIPYSVTLAYTDLLPR